MVQPEPIAELQSRLSKLAGQKGFTVQKTADGRLLISVGGHEVGHWAAVGERLVLSLRNGVDKESPRDIDEAIAMTLQLIDALWEEPSA
jgi:hypothetical protein